ncbi:hypothetical protein EJ02DRAFT_449040 [Clathrospora elynae]|uniref:Uncharacterized protein n=1 Tax=Clathrospora elynae TaxID=706981 RepID=A0A6A5S3U2_9PLEO|nr:hypothetical protein EJ02DRAFT_449041 [Clathrospora elynae]KAF1934613.1 hypothetical protein EJ02DRAFT_449040 [Clathrospora elynae]
MSIESDTTTTRLTVVLDKASDWHDWIFIRKDIANRNGLWQTGATRLGELDDIQRASFQWEYERYEKKIVKWEKMQKALADLNTDISKSVAKRHLYLIRDSTTPLSRLTTLQEHLAPTDATRSRELAVKYRSLLVAPRGKKVEDWLRMWVEISSQCVALEMPEVSGTRAQEDFWVTAKVVDPEYATAALREIYKLESEGTVYTKTVEQCVAEFTNYLRRILPMSTGLSSNAAELGIAGAATTKNPKHNSGRDQPKHRHGRSMDC